MSKTERTDRDWIADMIGAATEIVGFVAGRKRADLDSDLMLRRALERSFEILGEAAKNVSAATRKSAAEVPWPDVAGMRDKVSHAYFDIKNDILWATATRDVPDLLPRLEALLKRQ